MHLRGNAGNGRKAIKSYYQTSWGAKKEAGYGER